MSQPTTRPRRRILRWVLLGVGLFGYVLERLDYPSAPIVLGLLLGPMIESQLRLALTISGGNASALVSTPIAVILALLSAAILLTPAWRLFRQRRTAEA